MRPLPWRPTQSDLAQLWTGSGPILNRFWTGLEGLILDRIQPGSGLCFRSSLDRLLMMLDQFWTGFGPVLDLFRIGS